MSKPFETSLEVIGSAPTPKAVILTQTQRRVLEQLERGLPDVKMPARLTWRFVGGDGAGRIEVGMSDAGDSDHPAVRREYNADWVTGPETSGLVHLEVLGDLTAKRTAEAARRVERQFVALEDGGEHG